MLHSPCASASSRHSSHLASSCTPSATPSCQVCHLHSPFSALLNSVRISQFVAQRHYLCCRDTVDCQATCTAEWVQGHFSGICLCAGGLYYTSGFGILGRCPCHVPAAMQRQGTTCEAVMLPGEFLAMAAADLQAFGNNISQLVVLSIQPVTDWAVTAAEIML